MRIMDDDNYSKGTRVYIGGLNDGIKKEDLESEFEKYGKLNSVWVAFNPPGFAFIEFLNKDEAETACDKLNGTELMGAKLRVEISRDRGRGRRGGFRGGRGMRGGGSFVPRGGGYRGSTDGGGGDRGGGYRGGRGRGRYDDYGSRPSYSSSSGRDYDRDGGRDSYSSGGGGRGGYGGSRDSYGSGGGGGSYDSSSRFRSRSPVSRGPRY